MSVTPLLKLKPNCMKYSMYSLSIVYCIVQFLQHNRGLLQTSNTRITVYLFAECPRILNHGLDLHVVDVPFRVRPVACPLPLCPLSGGRGVLVVFPSDRVGNAGGLANLKWCLYRRSLRGKTLGEMTKGHILSHL